MKNKLKSDLKNKSAKELVAELVKSKLTIVKRRTEIRTGKTKNTNLSRLLDDCAVISTFVNQKKAMEEKL